MIYSFDLHGKDYTFNTLAWEKLNNRSYVLPSNHYFYEFAIRMDFNRRLTITINSYFLEKEYHNLYKQPMQFDSIDEAKEHIEKFLRTLTRLKAFI